MSRNLAENSTLSTFAYLTRMLPLRNGSHRCLLPNFPLPQSWREGGDACYSLSVGKCHEGRPKTYHLQMNRSIRIFVMRTKAPELHEASRQKRVGSRSKHYLALIVSGKNAEGKGSHSYSKLAGIHRSIDGSRALHTVVHPVCRVCTL